MQAQQRFVFTPVDTRSGLSENRVRYILQLPDGRMVISTEGITNIYDGTSFKYIHLKGSDAMPLGGFRNFHREYVDESYIWLKYQGKLLLMSIDQEQSVSRPDSVLAGMGVREPIADFFMDQYKNYWIRTVSDKLLFRNATTGKTGVFVYRVSQTSGKKDDLLDLTVVKDKVYLFYRSGWMVCYDLRSQRAIYKINQLSTPEERHDNWSLFLAVTPKVIYQLWTSSDAKGLITSYDISRRKVTVLLKTDYWLNTPSIDQYGNFWVSCRSGMWFFDKSLQKKQFISSFRLVDGSEINGEISSQYHDSQGGLWIGTFNRGLLYYHPDRFKFGNVGLSSFGNGIKNIEVTGFADTPNGILVGTSRGLYTYNAASGLVSQYPGIPNDAACTSLIKDSRQRIWICTDHQGLYSIQNNGIRHYDPKQVTIRRLCETADGALFASTNRGIEQFNPENGAIQLISRIGSNGVSQLISLDKNRLLGKGDTGLFIYNFQKRQFSNSLNVLLKKVNQQYNCIYKDKSNRVWIGTQDGLCMWMPGSNSVQALYTDDGLVNNSIKSVIEDRQGRIWVTTAGGVSRIVGTRRNNKPNFVIANFNHFDGVLGNEFSYNSILLSKQGLLLMGGVNGFNVIDLQKSPTNPRLPKPVFTNLMLFGNAVKQGQSYDDNIILKRSVSSIERISLNYNQNFIGIEFSALNYINPTQTYFRYRLEGVDDNWREIYSQNGTGIAGYTNLSPGIYRLKVKSANNSKEWTAGYSEMIIEVKAPFWKTPLAYLIYLVVIVLAAFFALRYYRILSQRELARRNEDKLNLMKFNFFTNISHEFRTPLTLIVTPIESLLKEVKDSSLEPRLRIIYRHARDLQNLVNQLLDFRRLEVTGEKLNLSFGNIVDFISSFKELFSRLALAKGINFDVNCSSKEAYIYFDREKLYRILNNLLSNAFKYTPGGGQITLSLIHMEEQKTLKIEVSDTGKGIPESELPDIFNRFYQVTGSEEGSGIGLHLVKEYVRLHSGEVSVKSEPGKGTCFTILLPMNLSLQPAENVASITDELTHPDITVDSTKRYRLLVVEDNEDLRTFLIGELAKSYDVLAAADGKAGLELAKSSQPDLIISDVMMPEMNGLELCQRIKSDLSTSHIPVILLTARTSEEHKLEGFGAGADEYLSKPFNLDLLLLRITKLIEQQNLRQHQFTQKIEVNPKEITISSLDRQLVEKALACIERNMDNPEFSVQQFSEEMSMDRTVLYKKLQSITGMAPSDFIRSIRLKRAAQLLAQGQMSVSEVADRVGFNTHKYFTRYFRETFGVTPSQYAQNYKNHPDE
ncbi:MAG: ATP-binding protein [Bacteroidota bacterium]|nr:ATP-binding protein [Bacteroidota bacterium]